MWAAHDHTTVARGRAHARMPGIQDLTDRNVIRHPATRGLEPFDQARSQAVTVHAALAVRSAGVPLGLIYQDVWARDPDAIGTRQRRRQRETNTTASQRRLTAQAATQPAVPIDVTVSTVADREVDIDDLGAAPRRPGDQLLIRATHHRRVQHDAREPGPTIRWRPMCGHVTIELQRTDDRPPRPATVTVRTRPLTLLPPRHQWQRASLPPLPLHVVLAEAEHPPPGAYPVGWLVRTTLPVTTLAAALRRVRWDRHRWLGERSHVVLTSGCRLEELQREDAERMQRAVATSCIVAWRLVWLTDAARQNSDTAGALALEPHAQQAALLCRPHHPDPIGHAADSARRGSVDCPTRRVPGTQPQWGAGCDDYLARAAPPARRRRDLATPALNLACRW